MAGYIKELMLDYAQNRLSVDMRSDLTIAIQSALSSGAFKRREIVYLDAYLRGYTATDISAMTHTPTTDVEAVLERVFAVIEELSGYRDATLVQKIERAKRYRRSGIEQLASFLAEHGKHFVSHDIQEAYA